MIKHLPSKSLSQPQGDFLLSNPGLHQLFLFVPLIDNWDVESLKVEGGPTQGRQCACTGVALGLIWQVTAQRDLTRTGRPWAGVPGRWRMALHWLSESNMPVERGPNLQFFCSSAFVSTDLLLPPFCFLPSLLPQAFLPHIIVSGQKKVRIKNNQGQKTRGHILDLSSVADEALGSRVSDKTSMESMWLN